MTRLVGRRREQQLLEEAVARLGEGIGGMSLVVGDAGAGKTSLVEAVLSSTDARMLRGGSHGGGAVAYGSLRAALRDHLRRVRADEADPVRTAPGLALLLPELGPAALADHVRQAEERSSGWRANVRRSRSSTTCNGPTLPPSRCWMTGRTLAWPALADRRGVSP